MNRTKLLGLVLLAALLAACGPDREVRSACETAKRWLDLDAAATERCLHEAPFRAQLRDRVDEAFTTQQASTHNRDRGILRPPPGPFTRLQRPADVPIGEINIGLGGGAEQYLGNRYVVSAQIAWLPPQPGERGTGTVFLWEPKDNEPDDDRGREGTGRRRSPSSFQMVGADALNAYQRHFLSEHCLGGARPTMCTGDAYLEIRRDVDRVYVTTQLVGAEFTDADATALLSSRRAYRDLPVRKPVREKGWWWERILDLL